MCRFAGRIEGECTIERVALVMNIVPCRDLSLGGQTWTMTVICLMCERAYLSLCERLTNREQDWKNRGDIIK